MEKRKELSKEMEKKLFTGISLLSFIGAFTCLSSNMTGSAIGALSGNSSGMLGIVFLLIGLASVWVIKIKE